MEILTIIGVTICVLILFGLVWLLDFVLSPYDYEGHDDDWYSDDEGL